MSFLGLITMPDQEFVLKYEPQTGIKSPPVFLSGMKDGRVTTTAIIADALRMSLSIALKVKSESLTSGQQGFYRPAQIREVYSEVVWKTGEEVTDRNIGRFR